MRIRFVVRQVFPEGGLSLAVFRLAEALQEIGHDAGVLFSVGDPPPSMRALGSRIDDGGLGPSGARQLARTLERIAPDLVLTCNSSAEWLQASLSVAPTLLHTHMQWGVCSDWARYWSRLHRPCGVRAGWHCTVLRPLLGCSNLQRTLDPRHVAAQQRLLALLAAERVGVVNVSTDQAELFNAHGISRKHMIVVPNLGIRMESAQLKDAANDTPTQWRSSVVFLGRLTKAKGAALLPALATSLGPNVRLRIFGNGYLASRLAALPTEARCGSINQHEVAGVLMWARAVVFPSLWPEPGGIAGVDAQVMGVPLAAFDIGAARCWPAAARFPLGDIRRMAEWLASQEPRRTVRDPEVVAASQASYWSRITHHASRSFETFARTGMFERTDDAPAENMIVTETKHLKPTGKS